MIFIIVFEEDFHFGKILLVGDRFGIVLQNDRAVT